MTTAWALLVVSSEPQAETLPHQRAWAERTARERGWCLARVLEGVASGNLGPRKLVRDLLMEIRATPPESRPKYVMMIRLDRLGRGSIVESQVVLRELLLLGVRVFSRDAGEVRLESAMDEIMAALQLAVGRHENDVRREKMIALHRRYREAGVHVSNLVAYGLYLTPERKLMAHAEYAPIIREAFVRRANGEALSAIGKWLQVHSLPHRYKNGKSFTIEWHASRVFRMLRQRSYIGTVVDEGLWLRAYHAERILGKARTPKSNFVFVLNGAVRCRCGYAITGMRNFQVASAPVIYTCRHIRFHDGHTPRYNGALLEEKFEEFLRCHVRRPSASLRGRAFGVKTNAAALDAKIATLRGHLDRLLRKRERVWLLAEAASIDPDAFEERLAALLFARKDIEDRLEPLMQQRILLEVGRAADAAAEATVAGAYVAWCAADSAGRKVIARAVAGAFGGLHVTRAGNLRVGPPRSDHRRLRRFNSPP